MQQPNPWTCTTCAAPISRGEYWIRMNDGEGESHCARCAGARESGRDPLTEVLTLWAELGTDERRVIASIVKRVHFGQKMYGKLNIATDPRDWEQEQAEEVEDRLVYAEIEWLKRRGR